ncbi:MAG: hypothetical protein KDI01_00575 [Halioglobus sp.]|nr:hypothetical protein [Halioglobus sp.]
MPPIARSCILTWLLLLSACSSTTFVYNRLDFLLPWYLDDYVKLDAAQQDQLDALLEPFLAWHRGEELPRYIALLDRIAMAVDKPLTQLEVARISGEFERAWSRLESRALDALLQLGAALSDAQVGQFIAELRRQQKKYRKKFVGHSDKKYRKRTYRRLLDNLQDYLGRLEPGQRELLRATSDDLLRLDALWLQERQAWTDRLEVILQREPGWQQRIRHAIARRDENASPQYRQAYRYNLALIQSAVIAVLNSRTPRQDRRLRRELESLREDLQSLLEQAAQAGYTEKGKRGRRN